MLDVSTSIPMMNNIGGGGVPLPQASSVHNFAPGIPFTVTRVIAEGNRIEIHFRKISLNP
jgi:hypothetical protein